MILGLYKGYFGDLWPDIDSCRLQSALFVANEVYQEIVRRLFCDRFGNELSRHKQEISAQGQHICDKQPDMATQIEGAVGFLPKPFLEILKVLILHQGPSLVPLQPKLSSYTP